MSDLIDRAKLRAEIETAWPRTVSTFLRAIDNAAPSPALTREALIAARPAIAKAIVEHYRIYDFHEVWTERGALHLLEHCIEPALLAGDKAEAPE